MHSRYFTIVAAALALFVQQAQADLIGFYRITGNASVDVASQLWVDVTDAGGGQVDFKFTNTSVIDSSITDIYFDDGTLLGIASVFDSGAGVDFAQGASPGNLPSGNDADPDFVTTAGFSADSEPPAAPNGVDSASEWVTIRFDLIDGKTYADTLLALENTGEGGLRIGLHVQSINGTEDASDAFVNIPRIPAPGAALLGLIGMGLVGRFKRTVA